MDSNASSTPAIAIDVMGSDRGPDEIIAGVHLALKSYTDLPRIILVGNREAIEHALETEGLIGHANVSVHHAPSVITMDDKAKAAYKHKKDASMLQAIDLVLQKEAGALVSCGNTGCLYFASTMMLRKLPKVERPALATVMPSNGHHFVLLDAGAEPNTSPRQLATNGIMGRAYAQAIFDQQSPKVGLLTIGTEEGKGTDTINKAHELMKQLDARYQYLGLIEGFDMFQKVADVVVTDGFTGNVVLKSLESCFRALKERITVEMKANPVRMLGYGLSRGAFQAVKQQFSPSEYGGALLLGLNGNVLKSHGSADRNYIKSAIRIARDTLSHNLIPTIHNDIETSGLF